MLKVSAPTSSVLCKVKADKSRDEVQDGQEYGFYSFPCWCTFSVLYFIAHRPAFRSKSK